MSCGAVSHLQASSQRLRRAGCDLGSGSRRHGQIGLGPRAHGDRELRVDARRQALRLWGRRGQR